METSKKGKLYLIPTPLGEDGFHTIPEYALASVRPLRVFVVEKAKVARHFLKEVHIETHFDDCLFFELNKHTTGQEIQTFLDPTLKEGLDIGLMSDAGVPAVADPGSRLVRMAHRKNVDVVPLVGPSSILLALMGSGMNGQQFTFHGYLSPKRPDLAKDLKRVESVSQRTSETQIFIEAPYRNMAVYDTALQVLSATTHLCVATDLTLPSQMIRSHAIMEWRRMKRPHLQKRPTIFLILGNR